MLTIFNGNDEVLVRAKARAHALSLQGDNCDFLVLESDTFSGAVFDESFFAQSFFGTSYVIFCDSVFENKESYFVRHLLYRNRVVWGTYQP